MQQVCTRLRRNRGAALVIDYGAESVSTDTLRGILNHRAVHPLHAPGHVDLSTDVDFGALRETATDEATREDGVGVGLRCPDLVCQRDFLAAMGLEARVNALLRLTDDKEDRKELIQAAGRLVASPGMGTAYKVFAVASEDVGEEGVVGFGPAGRLEK